MSALKGIETLYLLLHKDSCPCSNTVSALKGIETYSGNGVVAKDYIGSNTVSALKGIETNQSLALRNHDILGSNTVSALKGIETWLSTLSFLAISSKFKHSVSPERD